MKPLTKLQRHKIYKLALKAYEDKVGLGLCHVLIHATAQYFRCGEYYVNNERVGSVRNRLQDKTDITFSNQLELFPEIRKYKPEEDCFFWWDTNNTKKRIEVLNEAIDLTKP